MTFCDLCVYDHVYMCLFPILSDVTIVYLKEQTKHVTAISTAKWPRRAN